jgi:hypothetical protein
VRGTWRGRSFTRDLKDLYKRLWRPASFFIQAPLGKLERVSCTRDFERQMKESS